MMRIIQSRIALISALVIGYFSFLSTLRQISWGFAMYTGSSILYWLDYLFPLTIVLAVICVLIVMISVLSMDDNRRLFLGRVDFYTSAVISASLVLFGLVAADRIYYEYYSSPLLLLYTLVVYLSCMLTLAEFVVCMKDSRFRQLPAWLAVFKTYPINKPFGLSLAVLLVGNLMNMLFFSQIMVGYFDLSVFLIIYSTVSLIALIYLCSSTLSLSSEYEKAHEDKILAERFKAELITNVSHDIRTPLTSIINYVELLKALPVESDELTEYVAVLDNKSARLKTLIDGLMEASKAGSGNIEVDPTTVNLAEIIGQVAGEFDEQFTERGLSLVISQPEQAIITQLDSRHFWRVLENLFSNVMKYALPGTRVFADLSVGGSAGNIRGQSRLATGFADRNANSVVFSLRNTSEAPLDINGEALTEQFIRGDRARQGEGNGLGLYIAKSLVEAMDGLFTIRTYGDLFEVEIVFT
ncbi:MAG: HAMP domain-containing histidine kinase [Coriobacteriales bacterium]|jgi:signal transduction histidine kinase|nr:HAMP domain-containing histidine kinase [Coriobacteriales bacterium]